MELIIRPMKKEDWAFVSEIYKQGIDTNLATFQTQCPEYDEWDRSHLKNCRICAQTGSEVAGWACLSPISAKEAYAGVAEVSIYVGNAYKNKDIGTKLLTKLCEEAEKARYWTLQSSIFEDNLASIKLHQKCGFRMIGYREKIARDKLGNWRNTILMERRSKIII